jgi:hypothetical protein
MLPKHINRHSLMNYSLVTTLGKVYLDCSKIILFFSSPEPIVVLENQWVYPPLTREIGAINIPL